MALQHLIEGLDPTSVNPITPADLLQMVRVAKPVSTEGWIKWSDTAPDVVANPEMSEFLWGKTTGGVKPNPVLLYYWDGVAWTLVPIVNGALLANGSVPLNKLSLSGAADYYIILNHPNGTISWVYVIDAIPTGTVPPNKLQSPNPTGVYLLNSNAGVRAFTEIVAFFAGLANPVVPIGKIIPDGANKFARVNPTNTAVVFGTADISDLLAAGALSGQTPRRNAGNTGWEWYTATGLTSYVLTNGGAYWAVPGSALSQAIPHTVGAIPKFSSVVLRCVTPNNGYLAGDELDISCVTADIDGTNQNQAFSVTTDATNITVACVGFGTGIYFTPKAGGAFVNFVAAQWQLKAYALN